MRVKVNDQVTVLTGRDKGSTGKVLKIYKNRDLVLVEGMNMVFKHMKRSRQNPRGGRLEKEMPLQVSNVMLICPACKQPSRTGVRMLPNGDKARFCKKCDANINVISKPKVTKAN